MVLPRGRQSSTGGACNPVTSDTGRRAEQRIDSPLVDFRGTEAVVIWVARSRETRVTERGVCAVSESFEGDLVRPLGLVTLYFAYAEHELDRLLEDLSPIEPFDESQRSWNVGKKLGQAQRVVRRLGDNRLTGLEETLSEARLLFGRRNTLVHSCILATGRMLATRPGAPTGGTSAQELTSLAESIFNCKERINAHRQRTVAGVVAARRGG